MYLEYQANHPNEYEFVFHYSVELNEGQVLNTNTQVQLEIELMYKFLFDFR